MHQNAALCGNKLRGFHNWHTTRGDKIFVRPINFDLDRNCYKDNHIWKSIRLNRDAYTWYMAKHCKLNPIHHAMIVKHCKITWDTLSNSLMAAKHMHRQLRFILRPLKTLHHFCEHTKHCKTFVLIFVCCIAIIWIAFDRFWIVCMFIILKRLDATNKTHATNSRHHATYAKAHTRLKDSDHKVFWSACAPTVNRALWKSKKHSENGRKCSLPAFSPFIQCFLQHSSSGSLTLYQMTDFKLFSVEHICYWQNKFNS